MWRNVKCSDLNCIKYSGLISHIVCKIKWNLRIWLEHIYAAGSWCLGKLKMFSSHSEISDFQSNSGKTECKHDDIKGCTKSEVVPEIFPHIQSACLGSGLVRVGWLLSNVLTRHYSSILLSDTAAHHTQWPSRSGMGSLLPWCYS